MYCATQVTQRTSDTERQQFSLARCHLRAQAQRLAYRALMVPSDGFGTGRARLHTDAPRTFAFLKRQVGSESLSDFYTTLSNASCLRNQCMHVESTRVLHARQQPLLTSPYVPLHRLMAPSSAALTGCADAVQS
jgi:hypothetical protein